MIKSLWKITFTVQVAPRQNEVITLLDYGDRCEAEPDITISQGNATSEAIFQTHASHLPLGTAAAELSWTRYREVLTNAAARSIGLHEQTTYPWGLTGKITIAIQNGLTIDYARSALLSMQPSYPLISQYGAIQFAYTAALGKPTVVAGNIANLYLPPNPYLFWFEENFPWDSPGLWEENDLRPA